MLLICLLSAQAQIWYTWHPHRALVSVPHVHAYHEDLVVFWLKMVAFKRLGLWFLQLVASTLPAAMKQCLAFLCVFFSLTTSWHFFSWRQIVIRQEDKMLTHLTMLLNWDKGLATSLEDLNFKCAHISDTRKKSIIYHKLKTHL